MTSIRVAVTGMGAVCAAGYGVEALLACLRDGRSRVTRLADAVPQGPCLAAQIEGEALEAAADLPGISEALLRAARRSVGRAPRALQWSTFAALEAYHAAGLHATEHDGTDTALIVAGHNLSNQYTAELHDKFKEKGYLVPSYGLNFLDTHHVGTISELLGIRGEGFTVGGASGSGGVALVDGFRLIRHGYAKRCLVVGAPALLGPMERFAFFQMGAMGGKRFADRPEAACRPFDADREGFIPGEGAACLVLEAEDAAQARGLAPRLFLDGAARKLDGNRLTDPGLEGEIAVMRAVLDQAGALPDAVTYINAHGTASVLGDEVEAAAIRTVFGQGPLVNSTKALIGHCLYAAGVIEAVATLLQMTHGFVHGCTNVDTPMPDAPNLAPAGGCDHPMGTALSNSFGFGGINASALFRLES